MFKGEYPQSQKLQISHQINDKLFIFMIKVSKLVCCLPIAYCMQKISYPLQFSRWPPFFKMAAIYTEMYDIWLKQDNICTKNDKNAHLN